MKSIKFRPLRRIQSTGKIVVASYGQWRKIKTANYHQFNLTIDPSYKTMPESEFVYDSHGEQLFFFDINPGDIPIFDYPHDLDSIRELNSNYGLRYGNNYHVVMYSCSGLDCDGVPTFTHLTADKIASAYRLSRMNAFEPLTVGMVRKWLGWFMYNLENSKLTT